MTETAPADTKILFGRKRLHVITWGCQMNVYDSTRMADVLAPVGYTPAPAPEGADMVILNTCHIRDKATEKVFSELGRLRRLKEAKAQAGGQMILAVAGCVAQAEGARLSDAVVEELADLFRHAPVDMGTSILTDREAGRPMEWDIRNGVIIRKGRAHGLATPVSDVVVPLLAAAGDGPG